MAELPPRKPLEHGRVPSAPGIPRLDLPPVGSQREPDDREYFANLLKDQTDVLSGQIGAAREESRIAYGGLDRRVLELEKNAVEDKATRNAVQELNGSVREMLSRERAQDLDIGRLSAMVEQAVKPQVEATASSEGQLSGAAAGKRSGTWVTIIGGILTLVVSGVLTHCEQQLENYNAATSSPANHR